jgi:hypothetical protein
MQALIEIQSKLNAPKNQYNEFGKYRYRSCEDILQAAKPLLKENNAQLIISSDVVEIGGCLFLKETATIKADGETESATGFAKHPQTKKGMDDSQITGAASSYARKYALNGLFCIDDAKDADTQPPPIQKTQTSKQSTLPPLSTQLGQQGYNPNMILSKLSKQYPDQTKGIKSVDNLEPKTKGYILKNLDKFGDCKC